MPEEQSITIIGAGRRQIAECREALPNFKMYSLALQDGTVDPSKVRRSTRLILLFSPKTQAETLKICQQLRGASKTVSLPILLAANRYDVTHAFVVRQTGNAGIILAPFSGEELRESVEELAPEAVTAP